MSPPFDLHLADDCNRSLSVESAASHIGVSTATIRNWVKAGHLTAVTNRPLLFKEEEVLRLKGALNSGEVARLRARANKSTSSATFIPTEYADNPSVVEIVNSIATTFHREKLEIRASLFLVSLRVLELCGEVTRVQSPDIFDLKSFHLWKRQSMKDEIYDWHATLTIADQLNAKYYYLYYSLNRLTRGDVIGLIYQALKREGDKSTKGSYYTPSKVVTDSLSYQRRVASSFLDPCCGTGQYLVIAANVLQLPLQNIYGFDNDELAARIARINLLLAFPSANYRPNVDCVNSITELATGGLLCSTNHFVGRVDFVATNPPWGVYKNRQLPACLTNGIRSNEAFSLFLAKSIKLLKDGGALSFILPESILNIRVHADIRELILKQTRILRISKLGRQFSGVFTPVIRLDLLKGVPPKGSLVTIEENGSSHEVDQERFSTNRHYAFHVNITETEDQVLRKIHAVDCITLKGNAEWALGVVTGNNKEFVRARPEGQMEAVYKGSDIVKYGLRTPNSYLLFTPEKFQQTAKVELYRAPEKLIYKFISKSLVFAYDDQQRLTLNSANILIPRLRGISIKVTLAFLNSNVFQYLFSNKFSTHKVLRGDLETLPFPRLTFDICDEIEKLVNQIIDGQMRERELNRIIYATYGLTTKDISHIEQVLLK